MLLILVELLEKEEPQDEPPFDAPLPVTSLSSGSLVLSPEESDLDLLVDAAIFLDLFSPSATCTSAAAPLSLTLVPITVSSAVELLPTG